MCYTKGGVEHYVLSSPLRLLCLLTIQMYTTTQVCDQLITFPSARMYQIVDLNFSEPGVGPETSDTYCHKPGYDPERIAFIDKMSREFLRADGTFPFKILPDPPFSPRTEYGLYRDYGQILLCAEPHPPIPLFWYDTLLLPATRLNHSVGTYDTSYGFWQSIKSITGNGGQTLLDMTVCGSSDYYVLEQEEIDMNQFWIAVDLITTFCMDWDRRRWRPSFHSYRLPLTWLCHGPRWRSINVLALCNRADEFFEIVRNLQTKFKLDALPAVNLNLSFLLFIEDLALLLPNILAMVYDRKVDSMDVTRVLDHCTKLQNLNVREFTLDEDNGYENFSWWSWRQLVYTAMQHEHFNQLLCSVPRGEHVPRFVIRINEVLRERFTFPVLVQADSAAMDRVDPMTPVKPIRSAFTAYWAFEPKVMGIIAQFVGFYGPNKALKYITA